MENEIPVSRYERNLMSIAELLSKTLGRYNAPKASTQNKTFAISLNLSLWSLLGFLDLPRQENI